MEKEGWGCAEKEKPTQLIRGKFVIIFHQKDFGFWLIFEQNIFD